MSGAGYDWNDDGNGNSILIREQPATAVYFNPYGLIVVRQRAEVFEDDPYVVFDIAHVPTLIRRLQDLLEEAEFDPAEHDPKLLRQLGLDPKTGLEIKAPASAASRQKRYRDRKRNAVTPESDARVTETGGELSLPLAAE